MINIPVISWFDKNTVKHLRLSFSFFLLPVFLFSLSQSNEINPSQTILIFVILHILVFPSTNGYNSYEDKDEGSIGGLKHPPKVNKNLYKVTLSFDIVAIGLSLLISIQVAIMIFLFIVMSRLYSYRKIRLKKYPWIAFFIVFIFQGGYIYLISEMAVTGQDIISSLNSETILCMLIASLFIGSMYPLTQIYQHESDKKDGVISLSYKLGYRGTFIFSGSLFALASILMAYYFIELKYIKAVLIFAVLIIPLIIQMSKWFEKVKKTSRNANFDNTMFMNLLSSSSMNLYFSILILLKLF